MKPATGGGAIRTSATLTQLDAGWPENFYRCSACDSILEPTANGAHCAKCKAIRSITLSAAKWAQQRHAFALDKKRKAKAK